MLVLVVGVLILVVLLGWVLGCCFWFAGFCFARSWCVAWVVVFDLCTGCCYSCFSILLFGWCLLRWLVVGWLIACICVCCMRVGFRCCLFCLRLGLVNSVVVVFLDLYDFV